MAVTPRKIRAHITNANTTLYTHPGGGVTLARCYVLNFVNVTAADVTMDLFIRNAADSDSFYILDDVVVPAKGNVQITGSFDLDTAAETLKAIASAATSVDVTGEVLEYA